MEVDMWMKVSLQVVCFLFVGSCVQLPGVPNRCELFNDHSFSQTSWNSPVKPFCVDQQVLSGLEPNTTVHTINKLPIAQFAYVLPHKVSTQGTWGRVLGDLLAYCQARTSNIDKTYFKPLINFNKRYRIVKYDIWLSSWHWGGDICAKRIMSNIARWCPLFDAVV